MAERVRLRQLPSKLSDVEPTQESRAAEPDAIMGETDSRVPLLSSVDASRDSREGSGGSGEYGTSGNKTSAETTLFDTTSDQDDDDIPDSTDDAHGGVQQADAINLVWSRNALILAYVL